MQQQAASSLGFKAAGRVVIVVWACAACGFGVQALYFVTYTHKLEEPRNLEIAANEVAGSPKGGNAFLNMLLEVEYGVKAWWTAELYLSGQGTVHEGSLFTGYRIENRFRVLPREPWTLCSTSSAWM
jgi:hypothetical protein